jgi:NADPH:quinone reductase-like Zn-dependent oxidoreductase
MEKVVIRSPGGYDRLVLETCPDLTLGPADKESVVVDIAASGVNYADCAIRWGVYESAKRFVGWPITPGFEFAGRVREVGSQVTGVRLGDAVMGITLFGAYATQVRVPAKHLFAVPPGFSLEQAAGFPAAFMTAYHALFQLIRLPERASILVHSAGGGVGSALVQLGHAAGFRVVGVVGASAKVDYVRSLGADAVVDKSAFASKKALWAHLRSLATDPGAAGKDSGAGLGAGLYDAVLDANGPATLRESYASLRPTGKLVAYGSHGILPKGSARGRLNYFKAAWGLLTMPRFEPLRLINENRSVIGFNLSFLFERDDLLGEGMTALLALAREGKIRPPAVRSFSLREAAEAHRWIETGRSTGKLVLVTGLGPASRG